MHYILYIEIVYLITLLSLFAKNKNNHFIMIWFCILYMLIFPISGLYLYFSGELSLIGVPYKSNTDSYIYASLLSLGSIVIISFFYLVFFQFTKFKRVSVSLKYSKYTFLIYILMFVVSISTLILLFSKHGGLFEFISNIDSYRAGSGVGSGYLQYPATMILPTILFFYMSSKAKNIAKTGGKKSGFRYLLIFLISIIPIIILGFRGPLGILVIQFLFFYHHFINRLEIKNIIKYFLLFLIILTYWALLREKELSDNVTSTILWSVFLNTVLFRTRGIEALASIISKPNNIDYNFFIPNFIETFTSFLPRAIYTDKGYSTTEIITTKYFSNELFSAGIIKDVYGGVSATFLSHAYWSSGIMGIIFISMMTGIVLSLFQNLYNKNKQNNLVVVYIGIFISYTHFYIESFQLAINALLMNTLMYIVFVAIIRKRVVL
jgi:hypothetical protein